MNLVAFQANKAKFCRPSTFAFATSFRRAGASILCYWASTVPFITGWVILVPPMQPSISRTRLTELLDAAHGMHIAGGVVRDLLRQLPTDPRAICTVARPTTTKTRVLARSQQVVRFDEEEDE